jgi:hypothetical protein
MNLDESKKIFDQMNDFVKWFNAQPGQVDHTALKNNATAGALRRFNLFIKKAYDKYNQPSVGRKLKRFFGKKQVWLISVDSFGIRKVESLAERITLKRLNLLPKQAPVLDINC